MALPCSYPITPFLYNAIGNTFLPEDVSASPAAFNLPNLMGKVPWGTSSQVGTEMKAGMPDIDGKIQFVYPGGNTLIANAGEGALYNNYSDKNFTVPTEGSYSITRSSDSFVRFAASRSNSIYGASTTVQPPALCLLPCIRYE